MYIYPSSPESASSLQSEESAAIKIQAGFRGYRVRKHLQRPSKTSNGFLFHCFSNSQPRRHQRQQRHQHTNMENQRVSDSKGRTATATPNASNLEGVAPTVEDRCATKIQAGVRGFLVRKKQKIATDAAVKIQAGFRGFKARKEAQKLKQQ